MQESAHARVALPDARAYDGRESTNIIPKLEPSQGELCRMPNGQRL